MNIPHLYSPLGKGSGIRARFIIYKPIKLNAQMWLGFSHCIRDTDREMKFTIICIANM